MTVEGEEVIILEWCMLVFTLGFVLARLYSRSLSNQRKIHRWSDICVILAWTSFLIEGILDTVLYCIGFLASTNQEWLPVAGSRHGVLALKILYVEDLLYLNTMYFVKISILGLYLEFFPVYMSKCRKAVYITGGVVASAWILELLMNALLCWPISRQWTLDPSRKCPRGLSDYVWYCSTIPHVVTDFIIYALPIPVIIRLQMSPRTTASLISTFSIGFISIGFALVVFSTVFFSTSVTVPWLFAVLEETYAIIVSCCPCLSRICCGSRKVLKWRGESDQTIEIDTSRMKGKNMVAEMIILDKDMDYRRADSVGGLSWDSQSRKTGLLESCNSDEY